MLREVSKLLEKEASTLQHQSIESPRPSPATAATTMPHDDNGAAAASRPPSTPGPGPSTIANTLERAQNMMRTSASSGLFRRLSRAERSRSASPYGQGERLRGGSNSRARRASMNCSGPLNSNTSAARKPVEYALLRYENASSDGEETSLKWDSVIADGMIMLHERDSEKNIRRALQESIVQKFPLAGENDFEFVKVKRRKISVLQLGAEMEYNYPVVKKMAGQGLLYVRVNENSAFCYENRQSDDDSFLIKSCFDEEESDEDIQKPHPVVDAAKRG